MDLSFDVEKIAQAFSGRRKDELEAAIGKAFVECLENGHTFFRNSMELNGTEYMLAAIDGVEKSEVSQKWTSVGKTHDQMLKEKMAMHNGMAMPEKPSKRRGRPPRAKEVSQK